MKQDAIPGVVIPLWFVPTITTEDMRKNLHDDEFTYEIACAQLCGLGHYSMRGYVTINTPEGFLGPGPIAAPRPRRSLRGPGPENG